MNDDAEDRSWRESSYRQFLKDDAPEDNYDVRDANRLIADSVFVRLLVWITILWEGSLICCLITPFMVHEPLGEQISQILIGQPFDWIFYSSAYASVMTKVYLFPSASAYLDFILWSVFALAFISAVLTHLILFLKSKRIGSYALLVTLLLMVAAGEAGEIRYFGITGALSPSPNNGWRFIITGT